MKKAKTGMKKINGRMHFIMYPAVCFFMIHIFDQLYYRRNPALTHPMVSNFGL